MVEEIIEGQEPKEPVEPTENVGRLDAEGNPVEATPPAEAKPEGEPPAPAEGVKTEEGEVKVEDLTEAQLDKLVERLTRAEGPYHKNPAWKRILEQRDNHSKRSDTIFERLAKTNPQAARDFLMDEGYSETEAREMIQEMGITEPATPVQKADVSQVDEVELVRLLQGMGYDYGSMNQEQRDFWKFQYGVMSNFFKEKMNPVNEFITKSQEEKEKDELTRMTREHEEKLKELKTYTKDEFGMEWSEENDKAMTLYLKEHPKFVGSIEELFYLSHKDKLIEMGKLAKGKETAKLNEEKGRMNSEIPGASGGAETLPSNVGAGQPMSRTFEYLSKKQGG